MTEINDHPPGPEGLRMLVSPFRMNGRRLLSTRAPQLGEHDACIKGGQ